VIEQRPRVIDVWVTLGRIGMV